MPITVEYANTAKTMFRLVIGEREIFVPDDMRNRHRQLIATLEPDGDDFPVWDMATTTGP
ncbi:hypothetical protein GGD81_001387 [Rhodobium orientis]|uniref:Uncharacterized protein n=1 Tax=Rhodobium orientis TaxID=34017 RepID=A0A327JJV0_9HYPH|nr:hypothetical protein [Rhodobium orientis]MBB4302360.1 hypothetical protein [Rhodobium orientis]MBK5949064.1 hypothetical protein [Rhodobium orientis]RAI26609.1 hypothetical protein CH339_13490 [Rhodobium orientis]